jgi:hypothetical protein
MECQETLAPDKASFPIEGAAECLDVAEHSHDSFCPDKHKNWLVNSAGLGLYAHGRVHQEADRSIYVGDLIHKRGYLMTEDVLKMEEQSLESMGDPLGTNSKMGCLLALYLLPSMGTANGEGDLVGYYEGGVVSYDTFKFPRETRFDGDGAVVGQGGWDTQRLVNHLLNTVSAVGPNSVAVMPRDHFFRSPYGLHFLKTLLGEGSFNPENTNRLSHGVQPLMDMDVNPELLGAACGSWVRGSRLLATFGMKIDTAISPMPFGRGMVSLNQASTFTRDRTPLSAWEGAWVPDHEIAGIHRFDSLGVSPSENSFGFLASDRDTELYFAAMEPHFQKDLRDDVWLPIEWDFETAQTAPSTFEKLTKLSGGFLEGRYSGSSQRVRVLMRSDRQTNWTLWKEFEPCDKPIREDEYFQRSEDLGQVPKALREATWFQFRVEGVGYAEIQSFFADMSESGTKSGQDRCVAVASDTADPLQINSEPLESRWPDLQSP